jgi:Domain of unknown function (DUF2019)
VTSVDLSTKTTEELVRDFREAAFGLGNNVDVPKRYNTLFDRLEAISGELRRRGPDARRALLPLLEVQGTGEPFYFRRARGAECRYRAARELLAVEPDRARATLLALVKDAPIYQQALARGTLASLADGTLIPT